jgi:GT2 family glycosyltransferase
MTVTTAIVNYNGAPFLSNCLDSLLAQTHLPAEIVVVDNNSTDDSLAVLEPYSLKIRTIQTGKNLGFAGAANIAIRETRSDYFLLMNPDVFLTQNFIERLVDFAEADSKIGSLTGKLLRFPKDDAVAVIDSTGHSLFRNRWVINRGEGEVDQGQYEESKEVFGVCGAAAFYRRAMLEDIAVNQEYLDESFFLYLEDVDLDWRARLRGWKAYYVPTAIGYHQRGYPNIFKSKNAAVLRHCLKNRYLMMIKNEVPGDFFMDAWAIIPFELMRFVKFVVTAPRSLIGYYDVIKHLPELCKKRNEIQKDIRVNRPERRRWIQRSRFNGFLFERIQLFLGQTKQF